MAEKKKKWHEVYPVGTKEGDEEAEFFKVLARGKYDWRTVNAIVKETKLSEKRVEEIINKYERMGLVVNSTKDPEKYGYYLRVEKSGGKKGKTLAEEDHNQRLKSA